MFFCQIFQMTMTTPDLPIAPQRQIKDFGSVKLFKEKCAVDFHQMPVMNKMRVPNNLKFEF